MSAPTTAQFAAIEALKSCDDDVAEMRREYNYRRRYIVDGFRAMDLVVLNRSEHFMYSLA